jgi:hypothetical protein
MAVAEAEEGALEAQKHGQYEEQFKVTKERLIIISYCLSLLSDISNI